MKSLQKTKVPQAFKVLLSRLFGSQYKMTKQDSFTDTEWKNNLHKILNGIGTISQNQY